MRNRMGWIAAAGCCLVLAGCGVATAGSSPGAAGVDGTLTSSAASCAGGTGAQERAHARLIFDAIALSGRSAPQSGTLLSPARFRVSRYLKGHGPTVVMVQTAVTAGARDGEYTEAEDGLRPHVGQRWRIYGQRTRSGVITTTICAGSRRLTAVNPTAPLAPKLVVPAGSLPLPRGGAWYSEALDTSAATVANARQQAHRVLIEKWVTWQGDEFQKERSLGSPSALAGDYSTGDSEPGFGDWDALDVHTLPNAPAGVLRLLKGGRLEAGQMDHAERTSPLIWLAQLAAMLADDPNSPAARIAAFKVINRLPGLQQLGQVHDPQGRLGIGVAEQASNLHPILIAAGKACQSPYGGAGCVGVAKPAGRYELEMIFDPATHTILAVRTTAATPIPAAQIDAGTPIYEVSYLQGKVIAHPHIPPRPHPSPPTVESVPWHIAHVSGRDVTVRWSSGTCNPSLPPNPRIVVAQTNSAVTLTVLVHVVKAGGNSICAGVGLGGILSTKLAHPVGAAKLAHGKVTDHDK